MALEDRYDLTNLKNHMEHHVFNELERQLDAIPDEYICKCSDCVLDMLCIVLNGVQPLYRSSLLGLMYAKNEQTDIEMQVTKAIEKISQNPLCGNVRK